MFVKLICIKKFVHIIVLPIIDKYGNMRVDSGYPGLLLYSVYRFLFNYIPHKLHTNFPYKEGNYYQGSLASGWVAVGP